jgi:molybdopterin molybdotransferase
MLSVAEARARVLSGVGVLEGVERPVREAYGLVAARDLAAPHALPRFANSAMDGFAVRAVDVAGASEADPKSLRLVGEVRAGDPGDLEISSKEAARIMTGAPLPRGADAIVPVEVTEERDRRVLIRVPSHEAQHVRPAGDDVDEGAIVVRAGSKLGAGELAILASLGISPVPVHRRPLVAVITSGDELVDPEQPVRPGEIRDSNSVALAALVHEAGAELMPGGRVEDRREAVIYALERAAEEGDLVISSGGVSVGRYDFVKDAVVKLGRIDAWKVAMQPGKPVVVGEVRGVPFLGLPGNPVSIHVGFEQFVRPAIRKLSGCSELLRPTLIATLTERVTKRPGRLHFVRIRLSETDGRWRATPTGPQGSHIQSSLVGAHGVARFYEDETVLEAGSEVTVEVWQLPQR